MQYHLSEQDFKSAFGTSIHEYRAMPKWQQNNLKKKLDLFWTRVLVHLAQPVCVCV